MKYGSNEENLKKLYIHNYLRQEKKSNVTINGLSLGIHMITETAMDGMRGMNRV